jgi:hypothetical protein
MMMRARARGRVVAVTVEEAGHLRALGQHVDFKDLADGASVLDHGALVQRDAKGEVMGPSAADLVVTEEIANQLGGLRDRIR